MKPRNFWKTGSFVSSLMLALALASSLPGCAVKRDTDGPDTVADSHNGHQPTSLRDEPAIDEMDEMETLDSEGGIADNSDLDDIDNMIASLGFTETDFENLDEQIPDADEPAEDPAVLVAEALEACEFAREYWEQGQIEEALNSLDHAYEMLLDIPADNPDLAQGKQDLRHLISRRIVEIYRSRLTSAIDLGSPIPVEINVHVEREIKSFQRGERDFFMESYRRSGQYRPMIVRMLKDAGLPEELSWLPLVESGFKTRALSRARALGMWQFISSTGYRYGLGRSTWIDERMDPEKSTQGAIDYLTDLHGMFGDWMLALAGYNCGENRVARVIRRQEDDYLDHFWDIFEQLPRETARYVPRLQATLLIVRDPAKYGFDLPEPLPPVGYERVAVQRHVKLDDLNLALGLGKGTLAALNPELRRGVTPREAYELNVPAAAAPTFETKLAQLPAYTPPQDSYITHRVRSGESLSTIARRHGSSVNAIVRANNLRSRNRIQVGQRLKVPKRGATVSASKAVAASGNPKSTTHRVRRGDSLWKLASKYGTTVDRIKRDNGLRNDRLHVDQRLVINTGVASGSRTYAVRRGDTVGKIASRHSVSINAMLRANGLSRSSKIFPGQVLVIPN